MKHSNKLLLLSVLAVPMMAMVPATAVDDGRLAVEQKLFSFIEEQVSARLYSLERNPVALISEATSRAPASVDLVPKAEDVIYARSRLSIGGRLLARRITSAIFEEGRRYNFDPLTVFTIVDQESHMNIRARGQVGERGLIQIRPSTAQATAHKLKVRFTVERLDEPEYNLHLGLAYLKSLKKRYRSYDMAYLDAYNLGPAKMIHRSIASKAKVKQFTYSLNLAKRREILLAEYYGQRSIAEGKIQ